VQLMGATVIAAAAGEEKLKALKALGADHVINYKTESMKDRVNVRSPHLYHLIRVLPPSFHLCLSGCVCSIAIASLRLTLRRTSQAASWRT